MDLVAGLGKAAMRPSEDLGHGVRVTSAAWKERNRWLDTKKGRAMSVKVIL